MKFITTIIAAFIATTSISHAWHSHVKIDDFTDEKQVTLTTALSDLEASKTNVMLQCSQGNVLAAVTMPRQFYKGGAEVLVRADKEKPQKFFGLTQNRFVIFKGKDASKFINYIMNAKTIALKTTAVNKYTAKVYKNKVELNTTLADHYLELECVGSNA